MKLLLVWGLWVLVPASLAAQAQPAARPPVIDVHMHAPLGPTPLEAVRGRIVARLAALDSLNVRAAIITGVPDMLRLWSEPAPDRLIPALLFPCENGRAPNGGRECFQASREFPDLAWIREEVRSRRIAAPGEITAQYLGIEPGDARLDPYFALAEELDIPVFIHLGLGPPGVAYETSSVANKSPNFRAAAGNPLLLEEVLLRHKKLRVAVMHGGWPMQSEMLFILHQHPQVYVDLSAVQSLISLTEYYSYLKRLVDAGFGARIMFGSDAGSGSAGAIRRGIDSILQAEFLTESQKRDILCGNAAMFLRLPQSTCDR